MTEDSERDPRPRLMAVSSALEEATAAATRTAPAETGGLLIGFRAGTDVYVATAIEVPATSATTTSYTTSEASRNAALEAFRARHPDDQLGYVGTWHSHQAPAKASPTDKRTLRTEAALAPDLVAMLVLRRTPAGWETDAHIGHHCVELEYRRLVRLVRRKPWVTPARVVEVEL